MCALAGVSRASYYRHWRQVAPRREQTELRDVLQRLAVAHRHYGYRRLNVLLRREGWAVNHKRVLRLMRTDNLLCLRRRAFVPATTDSAASWRVVPNLARDMELTGLDQLWVADITYLRLLEEFAFLAVMLDAFSRRVVGWALDVHLQARLGSRRPPVWPSRPAARALARLSTTRIAGRNTPVPSTRRALAAAWASSRA